jgi:hypothetical protein
MTMLPYLRAQYARSREDLLEGLINFLINDERFVAAWLTGSLGRNEGDDLSDLDLRVVVADAHAEHLCRCSSKTGATMSSVERLTLYEQFGQPLVLREAPSIGPTGGCFNHVAYRQTALVVDWVLLPQRIAQIPQQDCRILFEKIVLPRMPLSLESLEERVQKASQEVSTFWMMMAIGIKYLLRGNIFEWSHFMVQNAYRLQDVKQRVAGEALTYRSSHLPSAATQAEQIALIRQLCSEMLSEMSKLIALGGQVPEDPMSIIEVWLSLE